ncbi:hypothetical protein Z517_06630 [Fonsecaea pedrosoi CBS 271.37]|uniref:Uncharacterized protein n=1 Tax=Fonsecaea pedrosoi CBS 271.37 TaxID=1442368 RepID=A0A0D2GNC9_9EURO|nr:uncharacterized protein Z517_06630 [Fonsecaea pedrosoi CBS 271.37]KIW80015.1 hypothetical protein Z517_06630 [Fonsecaea pedrosoi CBS 271.37]
MRFQAAQPSVKPSVPIPSPCHVHRATNTLTILVWEDDTLPLGLTSITIGTATTATGTTVPLTVTVSLRGSGTTVLDSPLKSATLVSSVVHDSSLAAFSSAECIFYAGSVNLGHGASASIVGIVASASTHDDGSKVTFDEVVCMTCSYS